MVSRYFSIKKHTELFTGSYYGSQKTHNLPIINIIPAYAKLKNGKLTPDFSLNVLRQANQRIKAAIAVLA